MKLKNIICPESVGGYSVRVPGLPGCHSQGETVAEALANIREAAKLWLDVTEEAATTTLQAESANTELQEIEL